VSLRPKTAAVLALLVARAGEVVPRRDFLHAVWPAGFVGDNALSVCINELRQMFGDDAREPRFIMTAHRRGYRLVADAWSAQREGTESAALFVGRTAALATLDRWREQAAAGQSCVGFVAGQAGVGKTAVVDAFLGGLRGDRALLVGRGQCAEQAGLREPNLPILDALAGLCRGPGGDGVREVLHRCAPSWLAQVPGLLDDRELDALRRRMGQTAVPRMLGEFAAAAAELTEMRPLVLAIEDLHDGDRASVELISYLARRREAARLLLIGTYRPAEVIARAHPLHHVVRDLVSRGLCGELMLEPLSGTEVGSYLSARLAPQVPSAQLVADVHERTEGNALFVAALCDHLMAGGLLVTEHGTVRTADRLALLGVPSEVRLALERRVDALDEQDRELLVTASAVGAEFTAEAVYAGLSGRRSAAEIEECCDRLAGVGALLRPAGTAEWPDGTLVARYQFTHKMYREVLYHRIGPARRALMHRAAGTRIAARHG
jgi:predicted ATPase